MAIIDDIRRRLAQTKAPDITGTQKQLQSLTKAKKGKAPTATSSVPQASSVGEQAVQSELTQQSSQQQLQGAMTGQQLQQQQETQAEQQRLGQESLDVQKDMAQKEMAVQSELAREGLAGNAERTRMQRTAQEEMQTASINNAFKQNTANLASERGIQQDSIFSSFRQSNQELDMRQDAAKLEQLSFNMALGDREYVDELNAIGKIRNLEDRLTFQKEHAILSMGDSTLQMIEQLGWKESFYASEREFQTEMANMDIDSAIALSNRMISDANSKAVASGAITGAQSYNKGRDE